MRLYCVRLRRTLLFLLLVVAGCRTRTAPPLFERVPAAASGVAFANTLPQDSAVNIVNYLYYYNGGGVAAGDVDGDGLVDLYFTSNLGKNRLYRNLGEFRFEDVTDRAGVGDSVGWKSGVTMADVNGDGRLDIYVSGVDDAMLGRNVLYINNGDGTFSDRTAAFGLGFAGYGTQAAFFDYDGDGDLDMYLLNSSTLQRVSRAQSTSRTARDSLAGDRLYRNEGGRFLDVSEQAGVYGGVEGFGLGVSVSDFDLNGCPDVYVANDFPENDFLYLNQCDGTFLESITQTTGHTSRFSMGADAADFNNDGRPDIVVLDMLPDSEAILKTAASAESYSLFTLKLAAGYHPQYARNTLQLNRGVVHGRLRFSEIGQMAGIDATDWSWAPLFADFDNDGLKDLFVTNGIYRRPNDLDYIASLDSGGPPRLDRMPHVPLAKYLFRNNGDLTFTNRAGDWGLGDRGFSNGAAYADLDNDGNLDLVVNNVDAPASIYRNIGSGAHYLTVMLRGNGGGIGAKVRVTSAGRTQLVEAMPTRGFQSSVDPRLHFGLGTASRVDSLTVTWPDRRVQVLTNLAVDTTITLLQTDARAQPPERPAARPPLFRDITQSIAIGYRHRENTFFDFSREPLIPHLLSTEGPALAVGDATGDGLDDIYAGGAKWQPGELWVQQRTGRFRLAPQPAFRADSLHEDIDATFFDADEDGDLDLYVVSGGNEFFEGEPLRDRLYLNERGTFRRAELPEFVHNGSCVVPGDFNRDGHVDLFVGSRVVTRQYGAAPRSHLLQGDGTGRFRDVTPDIIANAGMVSGAAWLDGDLVVVGEWMPVKIFHQENGGWVERSLPSSSGWWNDIQTADLDHDGRLDLVLGNLGLNSSLRASVREPVRLYQTAPPIVTAYRHGVSYPLAGRDEFLQAVPELRARYPTYRSFGASRIEDIVPAKTLRAVGVLKAETFASAIALNRGAGQFEIRSLPVEAQFAPIYAALAGDFDGDSSTDLIVAGNFFGVTPVRGRYDASYGLLLSGLGDGAWRSVDMTASGLAIEGQVRRMAFLTRASGDRVIVVARNNDRLLFLQQIAPPHQVLRGRGVATRVR